MDEPLYESIDSSLDPVNKTPGQNVIITNDVIRYLHLLLLWDSYASQDPEAGHR